MHQAIIRLGSYTSILSGILLVLAHSFNFGTGIYGSVIGNVFTFAAHLLLVFAFFGLFLYQGERNGFIGFLSMFLGSIGNIIVIAIVYVEIAQASLGDSSNVFITPVTKALYTFGPLLFVLGMILLGLTIIRGKLLPTLSGYLLLIGTLVFAAASFSGNITDLIELIGSTITGGGLVLAGINCSFAVKKPVLSSSTYNN